MWLLNGCSGPLRAIVSRDYYLLNGISIRYFPSRAHKLPMTSFWEDTSELTLPIKLAERYHVIDHLVSES